MTQAFEKRGSNFMMMGGFGGMGQSPFGQQSPFSQENPFGRGQVFDGEATDVTPTTAKRITEIKPTDKQ
jgi:hypothetical protein